jgi:hypothetical protein
MKFYRVLCLSAAGLMGWGLYPAQGERISFNTQAAWQQWRVPTGTVGLTPSGRVQPLAVRKNTDAVSDAQAFGGGVRAAGSGSRTAALIMDGDPATGWEPDPADGVEKWWIEIDLGRVVTAEKVRVLLAEEAEPLQFFNVLLSSGEQFFTNALVPIEGTLAYGYSQRFGFNTQRQVELDFSHGSVRIVRIEVPQKAENVKIAELQVEAIGDNVSLGLIERGGSIDLITDLQQVLEGGQNMVDGNITTNWALQTFHQTVTGKDIFNRIIFDLGAHYWIDQIRIVGEVASAPTRLRDRYGNFFWYQILASDGTLAPNGTLRWHEVAFLPSRPENQNVTRNFDHSFPLQKIRYIQHYYPSTEGGDDGRAGTHGSWRNFGLISEYQVYGEGFPAEVRLSSPLVDLKGVKGLTSVEWTADTPPATRVEVRSRSGNEIVEEYKFFDKRGKEITQQKWEKTPLPQRGPVDTTTVAGDDWSLWSEPYSFSGELFKSPSPRRFAQVEVRLISDDPQVAPSISALHLNLENPIALETRGEVFPLQVRPGVEEEFTYFILPTFGGASQGFDRLILSASVPVIFTSLEVGGQKVEGRVEDSEGGFVLHLPAVVRRSELVRLAFRSTIYQNQTRFDVFLGNSSLGENVRQLVDEGDAAQSVESQSTSVQLPVDAELLANVVLSPAVLTPNGDGVGDQLQLEFDALKLFTPRPIRVQVYDLAGRKMRELASVPGLAQRYRFAWDGRDEGGQSVPPGTYLVQIEIEGDSRTEVAQRLLPVAY